MKRLLLVAALLVLAGCTDSEPTVAPTPSVKPSSATPSAKSSWTTVATTKALDGSIVPVYDGRHLVTSTGFVAGGTDLTVRAAGSDRVVARYDTPPGYVVQGVWLSGDWMLVEETEFEPRRHDIRLYRFDLRTGARSLLRTIPAATEPDMQATGDVLAYVGDDAAGRQCLHRLTISTLAVTGAGCVPRGSVLGDPAVGTDGTIVYSRVDGANTSARCKRLFRWEPGGTSVVPLAGVQACAQWSGAALANGLVWSEVRPNRDNIAYSNAYAQPTDGRRVDLGPIVTGTIEPCGAWIYWKAPADRRAGGPEAIYRWRPGTRIEAVRPPADTNTVLTPPTCSGTTLTIREDHLQPPTSITRSHSSV